MVEFINPATIESQYQNQVKEIKRLFSALEFGIKSPIQYEFTLMYPGTDKATWKMASGEEFIAKIPFLNDFMSKTKGFHVWFRPNVSSCILVDDLTLDAARRMYKEGFEPSAIVQTSPESYQAWVYVSNVYIRASHATEIARYLADRFGGDPACCSYRHYGRLAGYPNVKPQYRDSQGCYPMAKLIHAEHRVISRSHELLVATKGAANKREEKVDFRSDRSLSELWEQLGDRLKISRKQNSENQAFDAAKKLYQSIESYKLRQQIDVSTQRSETDLAVVCALIHRGYSIEAIAEGVTAHSFNVRKRHPKLDDYLRRTIARGLLNVIEEKSSSQPRERTPQLAS